MKPAILPLAVVLMAAVSSSALCQTVAGTSQSAAESAVSQSAADSSSAAASQSAISSSSATSAAAADTSQAPKDSQAVPLAPATTPGQVLYTVRQDPPHLVDSRLSYVELGLIGVGMMMESGKDIVKNDAIANPGNDIAQKFAVYFADQNGLSVDANALPVGLGKVKDVKAALGGQHSAARYVVDAGPANLNLIYFSFDWGHDDLIFSDWIEIFDTQTGKVVLSANCFIPSKKDSDNLKTRDEFLADNGTQLKALISKKADMCVSAMEDKAKAII